MLNELRPCGVDTRGPITLARVRCRHFDDTGASVAALFASCQDAASQVRGWREGRQKAVCIARVTRARAPLYQCADRHMAELRSEGRLQRLLEERVIDHFVKCASNAEIRTTGSRAFIAPECRHDYLLAFACKARYFCPSCHQKRVLARGRGRGPALPGAIGSRTTCLRP